MQALINWLSAALPKVAQSGVDSVYNLGKLLGHYWDESMKVLKRAKEIADEWGMRFWAAIVGAWAAVEWIVDYVQGVATRIAGYIDSLVMPASQGTFSFGHWAAMANTFFPLDEFFTYCVVTLTLWAALITWKIVKRVFTFLG